jgi:predicted ester cyclase
MPTSHAAIIGRANRALLVDRDLDAADEFFALGYVAHGTGRDLTGGPAAVRRYVGTLLDAFEALEVSVEVLADDGDRVAWQRTLAGAQSGGFLGFPATGRRIVWRDMLVTRFEGDKIAEEWVVTDLAAGLLQARKG